MDKSEIRNPKSEIAFPLRSAVKWTLFAILVFFVGRALYRQLVKVDWNTVHFDPVPIVLATIALIIVYAARMVTFRALLAGYGAHVTWRQASIVGWVPQIGKYIPGQVASVAGAVHLLRGFGVSGIVALSVVLVMDGLLVLTGLFTGSPLLLWEPVRKVLPHGWLWCALLMLAGATCLHPKVYGRLLNFILHKLRRGPLEVLPPLHHYAVPVLLGFMQWILAGVALWLVTRSIAPVEASRIPLFIGIAALAYTAGFLVPFAPGGLG
ncbi:MAG: hypothetical protein ACREJC_05185, partial [Tepidisphaeraceae bacterium]